MPKHLTEILQGVKASTVEPMDVSDREASSGGRAFAAQHKIEKWQDRVGNKDDVYKGKTTKAEMKRHGMTPDEQKKVNESDDNDEDDKKPVLASSKTKISNLKDYKKKIQGALKDKK